MTAQELREKRARLWEETKAFLDKHQGENGILSAEDDAVYTKMEADISALGKEIERAERRDSLEAELALPTSKPLTGKPDPAAGDEKTGTASALYRTSFWNAMRAKAPLPSVLNALQIGTDSEGGVRPARTLLVVA